MVQAPCLGVAAHKGRSSKEITVVDEKCRMAHFLRCKFRKCANMYQHASKNLASGATRQKDERSNR